MTNASKFIRHASIAAFAAVVVLVTGSVASAQRDPFKKAGWATPKTPSQAGPAKTAAAPVPVNYGPPPIEARIDYYKRIREQAAAAGNPLPKVTSVLTLSEMVVTGIFKTPRGWAAMVQATPINLSYTVMPGEKFFDGQLVAVEENRLIFKRVAKVGPGKFVSSVENKPLRKFTMREQVAGTAPEGASGASGQEAKTVAASEQQAAQQQAAQQQPASTDASAAPAPTSAKKNQPKQPPVNPFLSPLDEMNSTPEKADPDKKPKKSAKVARNGK